MSNKFRLQPEEEPTNQTKEDTMKTMISALIAVAVLAGVAVSAGAAPDAKKFYEQLDRSRY